MSHLIVNGDDFGASQGINQGIVEAHRRGILTSTSLMVNMPATDQAVALATDLPAVSIGLHVNLTNEGGPPVVDLSDSAACHAEVARQIERFCELMGRAPTHLDSHHNIHREPALLPSFVELARRHRLPLREHSPARYHSSFYGQWDGETHLEQVSVEMLLHMLATEMDTGIVELSCHPGYVDEDFESVYAVEREAELQTLCDPRVRYAVTQQGIRLVTFADLADIGELTA